MITHRLLTLRQTLIRALPLAGSRQLADGPTVQELTLESELVTALGPELETLYRYPLDDLETAPEDESDLYAWLLLRYDNETAVAALLALLALYLTRAVNVGGQLALQELGLSGIFQLRNQTLLTRLRAFARSLVSVRGTMSLTATTAQELVRYITAGREAGLAGSELVTYVRQQATTRAPARSGMIAATETVRGTRTGLAWTYGRNDIDFMILRNDSGGCVQICQPLQGERYPTTATGFVVGPIPLHPNCQCYYEPALEGWTPPAEVWTGE